MPTPPPAAPDFFENPFFSATRRLARTAVSLWLRRGCGLEVTGPTDRLASAGPFILASTHASHLDFWAVLEGLPPALRRQTCVAAARDYFYHRAPQRWFTRLFAYNNFPFDRKAQSAEEYRNACSLLRRGCSLLIFPEGSRSRDGGLQPFKPIASMLAIDCAVPVVPVVVTGTHAALPPGQWFPKQHPVRVSFGAPIEPPPADAPESFHRRIQGMQKKLTEAIHEIMNVQNALRFP